MPRLAPTKNTIRALFAKSGNQCAFPHCTHELIDNENVFVAQICHISAAEEGGERFNPSMTDEERRSIDNLLCLCYMHQVKTNNVIRYTRNDLIEMKRVHEMQFAAQGYKAPENTIRHIHNDQEVFARRIAESNREWITQLDVAQEVNYLVDHNMHISKIENSVAYIEDVLQCIDKFFSNFPKVSNNSFPIIRDYVDNYEGAAYFREPLASVLWERRVIGGGNSLLNIKANLLALRIHGEYARLQASPSDERLQSRIDKLKAEMLKIAGSNISFD